MNTVQSARPSRPHSGGRAILGLLLTLMPTSVSHADRSDEMSAIIMWSTKQYCDSHSPGFRTQAAPGYEKWREKHKSLIDKLESGPRQAISRPPSTDQKSEFEPECRILLDVLADQLRTPDARLTTPDGTWSYFLLSLRVGDPSGVMSCFHASVRSRYAPVFEPMTPEQMKAFADNMREFILTATKYDPYWEAVVVTRSKKMYTVTFAKDEMGWRITSM